MLQRVYVVTKHTVKYVTEVESTVVGCAANENGAKQLCKLFEDNQPKGESAVFCIAEVGFFPF